MALADRWLLGQQPGVQQRLARVLGQRALVAREAAREVREVRVVAAPLAHAVEPLEDPAGDAARRIGVLVRADGGAAARAEDRQQRLLALLARELAAEPRLGLRDVQRMPRADRLAQAGGIEHAGRERAGDGAQAVDRGHVLLEHDRGELGELGGLDPRREREQQRAAGVARSQVEVGRRRRPGRGRRGRRASRRSRRPAATRARRRPRGPRAARRRPAWRRAAGRPGPRRATSTGDVVARARLGELVAAVAQRAGEHLAQPRGRAWRGVRRRPPPRARRRASSGQRSRPSDYGTRGWPSHPSAAGSAPPGACRGSSSATAPVARRSAGASPAGCATARDGSVEAVFEGAPDAVEALVEFTRAGPGHAQVEALDVDREEPEGLRGFDVR